MGRDAVQKSGVMADDQNGQRGFEQELFEPGLRSLVQVVRRLVEHEHIGIREQQVRQRDAHPVAAGERFDGAVEVRLREAQSRQDALGFMFRILVAMGGIQDRLPGEDFQFLREISDPQAGALSDCALIRRFLAQDHAEQRGFPGAVRTDQSGSGLGAEVGPGVLQEQTRPILLADVLDLKHRNPGDRLGARGKGR